MDLGKWLRSRRDDVANIADDVRQTPNRLFDLFNGPQKAQLNKHLKVIDLSFNLVTNN
jgi:hypothetical protein